MASSWPPRFGICNKRRSKRVGAKIDIIHQRRIGDFNRGINPSNFRTRCGHGKSFTRYMKGVAEMATPSCPRLKADSFALRPAVQFVSPATLPASVTARFATLEPFAPGTLIHYRFSV